MPFRNRWWLALGVATALSCQGSGGTRDEELSGLVKTAAPPSVRVDVNRAGRDAAELGRALAQAWSPAGAQLGDHALRIEHTLAVRDGAALVESLGETTTLVATRDGSYHATYENTADYGREVIYLAGTNRLYLRPRYARWHRRAPEATDEPAAIRDQFAAVLGADFELISRFAQATDRGAATEASRSGRRIAIALAAKPRPAPTETDPQRAWRADLVVEQLAGEVVLDDQTGAPLRGTLTASVRFVRDGKPLTMQLSATHTVSAAPAPTIAAPPDEVVVATPERRREVDDRNFLLQGIAPPVGKAAAPGAAGSP